MLSRLGALGVAALLAGVAVPASASAAPAGRPAAPTTEEARLDRAAPQEILRKSGFDSVAPEFSEALKNARSYDHARRLVVREGQTLWQRAVDRAQGKQRTGISADDDRPLYWARLGMTRELRQWEPDRFTLTTERRARLMGALERSSRGQDSVDHRPGKRGHGHVKRILVTGFDPFTLDRDVRISNPSGAAALALDGTTIRTADGPARVEAVVFPVRWDDFADGAVERALRPYLPRVDLFTTISQGRVGRFDVERTNGAWRGGFGDNENLSRTGIVPVSDPGSQPQWTSTTLPYKEIVAAKTGRFPVYDNTSVTEIPAGGSAPVVRPDGPTEGSTARAGGGGDYLSNEIAYRATLLRDRLGLHDRLPGGHVHTPVLQFGAGNTDPATGDVTDPEFVRNRLDIIDQVRGILRVAASS
ncbi:pyroglutamyl peptidase [Streptomyces venezuelae]|uniref:pyroglutamyl peptidase n=1 Tax=Streptomyces venezuelae TaxID=54571 RepID=UPI001680F2AC|nr:pyroglutamyl peptidase [Streptomyces venezuelae]